VAFASVRDKYNPIQSSVIYSYLSSIICCIPLLAPILGSILTEYFGWRSNFEFLSLFALLSGLIIIFSLPETLPNNTIQYEKLITVNRFIPILKHPIFLFNTMIIMIAMAIILAYVSSSPAWIIIQLQQSQEVFVFWFSLNAAVNIIAYYCTPKVLIKFGVRKTVGFGLNALMASGVLMLLLESATSPSGFMLPVMLSSIGVSLLIGTCLGQALSPFGKNTGSASALLGFFQMSGAAILVSLLQLLPLNVPEHITLLIFSVFPAYICRKLPRMNEIIYPIPVEKL